MIDNIIGAVARAVIADITNTPVDDIVTAVLGNLPLKDDKDEYDIIFKLFTTLFSSQHQSFSRCLPKIIECSAIFFTDHETDKVNNSLHHSCHYLFIISFQIVGENLRISQILVETSKWNLWSRSSKLDYCTT